MTERLFSPHWYRVASIKPMLRHHLTFNRHIYREQVWYLLQDTLSGRTHRFNNHAYRVMADFDGRRTLEEIWQAQNQSLGDDAPTQDDLVELMGRLYQSDLLGMDVSPDLSEILQRKQQRQRQQRLGKIKNPMAIRIPLVDPDAFVSRWISFFSPLFSRPVFIAGSLLMGLALLLALKQWAEISAYAQQVAFTPDNLLLLVLLYPFIKGCHELGHAFVIKKYGGEVHEMGIMLLVLAPVPYVDGSASSFFKEKRQRMLVSAAGILVELYLSVLALFFWLYLHDGLAREIAFNVMLIGGVSTLLFNGNPLLRFDGYYVLADLIEIPDLGKRANRYYFYLIQRYLFRTPQLSCPASSVRERLWFISYGLASFVYRLFIIVTIAVFIATRYFVVGVILVFWMLFSQVIVPLAKAVNFLVNSPVLQANRSTALVTATGLMLSLLLFLALVPLPLYTLSPGIVWLPERSHVRAGTDGFVETLLVEDGQYVSAGTPLAVLSNPALFYQMDELQAQQEELEIKYQQSRQDDQVAVRMLEQELKSLRARISRLAERIEALTVVSAAAGKLVIPDSQNLTGQFIRQGSSFAYLFGDDKTKVRVMVAQPQIALVREQTRAVEVRLSNKINQRLTAEMEREVPSGTSSLPSKALSRSAGGVIATDHTDTEGLKTLEPYFQIELRITDDAQQADSQLQQFVGQRVHVRFDHGLEPLGKQWYRLISQSLLTKLGV